MNRSDANGTYEEIDRFDGGVGWIAYPGEMLERASHALAVDGDVWVIDPVDTARIDSLLAEFGTVRGVIVLLDRHKRDAAAVANRHDVDVYLPHFFDGVARELDAPVEYVGDHLADTGYESIELVDNWFWQEAALYDGETLMVPEALGTTDYFLARDERLGVHPALRMIPPTKLGRLAPDRVLVGHGEGILDDARKALVDAVRGSRKRAPALYLKTAQSALPF